MVEMCATFGTDQSSRFTVMMRHTYTLTYIHTCIRPYRDYNFIHIEGEAEVSTENVQTLTEKACTFNCFPVYKPTRYWVYCSKVF